MDLDHFKRVDDAHGHQARDRALREVAERLRIWSDSHFDPKVVEAFLELEQEGLVGTFSRVPILGVM